MATLKYRPPKEMLVVGILTIFFSAGFVFLSTGIVHWASMILFFLSAMFFFYGLYLVLIFMTNLNTPGITLGEDYMILPKAGKQIVKIKSQEITSFKAVSFPEPSILITCKEGSYPIRVKWLSAQDLERVTTHLAIL